MSKPVSKLTFKIASPKKKRVSKGKVLTKLVYAVCVKSEDGEFKANLRIISNTQRITNMVISFTLASYSCKNKIRVFTKKLDERGKRVCHIRTPEQAKLAPEKSRLYMPFCEDWVYSGYIVRIGKQLYFDIKEAIWHKDFVKQDIEIPEDEIKI